jgi:hypothetical protein
MSPGYLCSRVHCDTRVACHNVLPTTAHNVLGYGNNTSHGNCYLITLFWIIQYLCANVQEYMYIMCTHYSTFKAINPIIVYASQH